MRATTIKLEGIILDEINAVKPKDLSISAFVRRVLHAEYQRWKMRMAAGEYVRFLQDNSAELKFLEEWESAELASPPKRK